MNKKVWIHLTNDRMFYKFFYPRFINIHVGDTIEWINKDNQHHTLVFDKEISPL
jgi:plastocyanin